jgi:hypothetical protein
MENEENEKNEKNEEYFICCACDFKCSYLSDWARHVSTRKHLVSHNGNHLEINGTKLGEKNNKKVFYQCNFCKKDYKSLSGLWKHKKTCFEITKPETTDKEPSDKELIMILINENAELKNMMMDVIKNGKNTTNTNTSINNNNNNSNNKTFNIQLFLNETCKDAMNIMDFVDSIKIQLADMESIGELGFVNGISKLIIKNLKALDENQRPVHCSDPKRDTMYVKDANVWGKEDSENMKIKKAIKYIAHKNICALPQWRDKYPDCVYSDSKKSDQYNHIVLEAMGGSGDNDEEKASKIVKKIAKEVVIDKNSE